MNPLRRFVSLTAVVALILGVLVGVAAPAFASGCGNQSDCYINIATAPSSPPEVGQPYAITVQSVDFANGDQISIPSGDVLALYWGANGSCTEPTPGQPIPGGGCHQAPLCAYGQATCTISFTVPQGATTLQWEAWAIDPGLGVVEYCSAEGSVSVQVGATTHPAVVLGSTFGSGPVTVGSDTPVDLQAQVEPTATAPALYICDQTTQRYESATPSTSSSPVVGVSHISGTYTYWAFASDRGGLQGTTCANTQYPPAGWANSGLSNPIQITWNPPTTASGSVNLTATVNGASVARQSVASGTTVVFTGTSSSSSLGYLYVCVSGAMGYYDGGGQAGQTTLTKNWSFPMTVDGATYGAGTRTVYAYTSQTPGLGGINGFGSTGNPCPASGVTAESSPVTVTWASGSSTTTTTTAPTTTTTTPPTTGTASFSATGDGKTVNGTGVPTKAAAEARPLTVPVGTPVAFSAQSPSDATLTGIYSGLNSTKNPPHNLQLCYSSGGCAATVTHTAPYERRYRALYENSSGFVLIGNVVVDWVAKSTTTTATTATTAPSAVSLSLVPPYPQVAPQPAHLRATAANASSGSTIEIVEAPSASAVAAGSPHAIATCRGSTCATIYVPPASFDQTGGTLFFRAILTSAPGHPHSATLPITWHVVYPT